MLFGHAEGAMIRSLLAFGVLAGLVLAAVPLALQQHAPAPPDSPLGLRFVGRMQPLLKLVDNFGHCQAATPANWSIVGANREGTGLDLISADRAAYAGYLITGKPGNLPIAAGITPEVNIHNHLSARGKIPISYGQSISGPFGYIWLPYEAWNPALPGEGAKGVVVYQALLTPGNPPGFVLIMRTAQTAQSRWEPEGAQAIAVALSIRCTAQLRAPGGGGVGGGGGRGGVSADDQVESTYNQQLGMEYAHDPDTGENYWMNHAADWTDSGPEGPGYYKGSKKLAAGRSN
jgi:hypothetical protein